MDLNIDKKINNLKPNSEPNAASTVTNSQTQSIGVVPVGKASEEDNPITQLINSEQFKALPKDEQLAELKKQFPNVDESQLNALLSTPKKEAPEVTDEGAAKTEPEATDEETKSEVTVPDGEDKATPKEQADMKALAQVGAEHGIKNPTVDDLKVIYNILSQKSPDELSPAEKKVMEFIGALSSKENRPQQIMKLFAENAQALDNIIPKEVLESKEWKSKTSEEKLYARMEIILNKLDPNFAKIEDPAQKEAYIKGALGSFAEMMAGGQPMSDAEKDYHISVVAFLADAAEQKGVTMSKLVGMMQDKSGKGQKEFLKLAIDIVDDKGLLDEYFSDKGIEKEHNSAAYLEKIADAIMKSAYPDKYERLAKEDPAALERIKAKAINIIGKQAYGEEWITPEDMSLEAILDKNKDCVQSFALRFKAAKYAGETKLADILGTPGNIEFQRKAVQQEKKYLEENGAWDRMSDGLKERFQLGWELREHFGELSVTYQQKYEYICSKNENDLTQVEKTFKARYEVATDYGNTRVDKARFLNADYIDNLGVIYETRCNNDIKKLGLWMCKGNEDEYKQRLNNDPRFIQDLAVVAGVKSADDLEALAKQLGIDLKNKQLNFRDILEDVRIMQGFVHIRTTEADSPGWQNVFTQTIDGANARGKHDLNRFLIENELPRSKDFNFIQNTSNHANELNFDAYHNSVTVAWRSDQLEPGWGDQLAHNALSSNAYSNDQKQQLTASYQMNAHSDQDRVTTAKFLSDIDNEGVQRGIVQGESYITDDSYKEQYSEVVTQMINSCSDPQRRESLTQYRQEVQANAGSSSSSSSSGTKGSKGASGTSGSKGSSGTSGTSTSSNTPKTGSSSSNSSAQSAAAQARAQAQQDYAQAVTQALQLRKEEALRKLAQITENYQKSVEEREERKAKEAQKAEEQSSNKDYSSFSAETRKILEESDRVFESADRTLEIAKIDSALTDAEITVPSDKKEELIQAYQSGGATSLYEKLGSVSAKYQEQYLNYFAEHANTSDLCSFAANHVGNKNIILALYQRSNNPALLQYLGESNALDLLNKGKIKLEDFLRYASPNTVARYIQSMKEIGNTDAIKAVVSQLSLKQREETSENIIAEAQNNTPLPGSDEWMRAQQKQMEKASNLGVEPKASAPKRETEKLNLDGSNPRIGAGMLSLNPEEDDFDGLSMGSNRVRMGIDIKKRDKRFFRMG